VRQVGHLRNLKETKFIAPNIRDGSRVIHLHFCIVYFFFDYFRKLLSEE